MKYAWVALFTVLLAVTASAADIANDLLTPYYKIRQDYATDSTAGVPQAATSIVTSADAYLKSPDKNADQAKLVQQIRDQATKLKTADLKTGREQFKSLSKNMVQLQHLAANKNVNVYYCGMAKAYWLQADTNTGNPYLGKEMPKCGTKVDPATVK